MRLVSSRIGNAIAVCVMAIVLGRISTPVAVSAGAAQDQQTEQKPAPAAPPAAAQPTPKPDAESFPRLMPPIPASKNIQVEITIIDQVGSEPPVKKTLNVIAADNGSGSIRSKATVAVPRHPPGPDPTNYVYAELPLNVDIRPQVTENKNRIRARLILNYETFYPSKTAGMPAVKSVVTVDQNVMLDNGKPLIVSQSADATTDRKVSVELKATVLP
jgi:hypothetical protein